MIVSAVSTAMTSCAVVGGTMSSSRATCAGSVSRSAPRSSPYLETGGIYDFGRGSDRVYDGRGFDVVRYDERIGGLTIDVDARLFQIEAIRATEERDTVLAGSRAMALNLRGGRDVVEGLADGARYNGGAGRDTLDLTDLREVARIDVASRSASVGEAQAGLRHFERILGAGDAANDITGGAGGDMLDGGVGDDRLDGGGAADTLTGGTGDVMLRGGADKDT